MLDLTPGQIAAFRVPDPDEEQSQPATNKNGMTKEQQSDYFWETVVAHSERTGQESFNILEIAKDLQA